MGSVALLGSVFLPASALQPFADAVTRSGHEVVVAASEAAGSVEAVLAGYAAGIRPGSVLVAHSNAGNYVPELARRTSARAAVFVDAVLPPFEGGGWSVIPPGAAEQIRGTAADGMLPPWTHWWPREDAVALFGSDVMFDEIDAVVPRVPVAYLDLEASARPGWADALPAAYLRLSDAYVAEQHRADATGWPTRVLERGHLGILRDPDAVATAVLDLIRQL